MTTSPCSLRYKHETDIDSYPYVTHTAHISHLNGIIVMQCEIETHLMSYKNVVRTSTLLQ